MDRKSIQKDGAGVSGMHHSLRFLSLFILWLFNCLLNHAIFYSSVVCSQSALPVSVYDRQTLLNIGLLADGQTHQSLLGA